MSLDERKRRRRALDDLGAPSFMEFLTQHGVEHEMTRTSPEILQLNIGLCVLHTCIPRASTQTFFPARSRF